MYENIFYENSNTTEFILQMLDIFFRNLVKFYII
jgi:hypothetical protein